jgi:hypothetical protein
MMTMMIIMDDEGAGGGHGYLSHWEYEFQYHQNKRPRDFRSA